MRRKVGRAWDSAVVHAITDSALDVGSAWAQDEGNDCSVGARACAAGECCGVLAGG
ncbi:hypothetical protein DM50_1480 [Burkholderia mallei]|nr:hypothetical protein DM75_1485 [Burkholderia mallei]KOT00478.1 hypothetical protein DM50_1480 [Burkholderia mallei]